MSKICQGTGSPHSVRGGLNNVKLNVGIIVTDSKLLNHLPYSSNNYCKCYSPYEIHLLTDIKNIILITIHFDQETIS